MINEDKIKCWFAKYFFSMFNSSYQEYLENVILKHFRELERELYSIPINIVKSQYFRLKIECEPPRLRQTKRSFVTLKEIWVNE